MPSPVAYAWHNSCGYLSANSETSKSKFLFDLCCQLRSYQRHHALGQMNACPPVVWSSPTKYYLGTKQAAHSAELGKAGPLDHERQLQASRVLLLLQQQLTELHATSEQQLRDAATGFQAQLATSAVSYC